MCRGRVDRFRAVVALAVLAAGGRAQAIGALEGEGASVEAVGAIRLLGAFLRQPAVVRPLAADDALAALETRLLLEGRLPWAIAYEAHLFLDLARTPPSSVPGAFATAGDAATPYRAPALAGDFWRQGSVSGIAGVDRLKLLFRWGRVDLSLGRFPVNPSITRLFTPNDFFSPFAATAVNRVFKPGVDAARACVAWSETASADLTAVMGWEGRAARWGKSAAVARAGGVLGGVEGRLLGGKLADRWIAGGSLQGTVGPVGLRGEGHVGFPDANGDGRLDDLDGDGRRGDDVYARLAAGLDVSLPWRNANAAVEVLFVSDGARAPAGYPARLASLMPDEQPFLGRHYLGASASAELLPILRATATLFANLADGSGVGILSLVLGVADEADLVAGLLAPWGARPDAIVPGVPFLPESEMGLMPVTAFAEVRVAF